MTSTPRTRAAVAATTIALIAACAVSTASARAAEPQLEPLDVPLRTGKLFDFGTADINGDGNLDLFTTNHKYLGSMLQGDGRGGFRDRLDEHGLNQTPDLPGVENLLEVPQIGLRGLYLYLDADANLHLVTSGLGEVPGLPDEEVRGSITFNSETIAVKASKDTSIATTTQGSEADARTTADFVAGANAFAVIKADHMDLPFSISVEAGFRTDRIFVGSNSVNPPENEFEITLRDRHGMAWGDFNKDGDPDVYMTNGGLGGAIARYQNVISDELFLSRFGPGFWEAAGESGLEKLGCRGRGATTGDYDGDGNLDLLSACKAGPPLLHRGLPGGGFELDPQDRSSLDWIGTEYRFVDIDGDEQVELIVAGSGSLRVFSHGRNGWALRQQLDTRDGGKQTNGISVADFDNDADPDFFLIARSGNTLVRNRDGKLISRNPRVFGLPRSRAYAVNWVDFDNDGLTDIHLMPKGVYLQRSDGSFEKTRRVRSTRRGKFGIASWPDLNNDGARDPIMIAKRGGIFARAQLNRIRGDRWLAVDLIGPPGNRPGVGARIRVRSEEGRQFGWVGQSEGSRYSSGHYRVYFGMGSVRRLQNLTVDWPDGYRSVQKRVATNQVKVVAHPSSLP